MQQLVGQPVRLLAPAQPTLVQRRALHQGLAVRRHLKPTAPDARRLALPRRPGRAPGRRVLARSDVLVVRTSFTEEMEECKMAEEQVGMLACGTRRGTGTLRATAWRSRGCGRESEEGDDGEAVELEG